MSIPAVQRYVIAWSERLRAERQMQEATRALAREAGEVVYALSRAENTRPGHIGAISVRLLDGSRWTVILDSDGLRVEPEEIWPAAESSFFREPDSSEVVE